MSEQWVSDAQRQAASRVVAERRAHLERPGPSIGLPPAVDAEYLVRHMARHALGNADLAGMLDVTEAAVSQWTRGAKIPRQRQRQILDIFGAPLRLEEATMSELVREIARRLHDEPTS